VPLDIVEGDGGVRAEEEGVGRGRPLAYPFKGKYHSSYFARIRGAGCGALKEESVGSQKTEPKAS